MQREILSTQADLFKTLPLAAGWQAASKALAANDDITNI